MSYGEPCSLLQLSIECNSLLRGGDISSKSDPVVVVYELQHGTTDQYIEIGKTEVIKNDLNPRFVKKFDVKFYFERMQKFLFKVYDADDGKPSDYLGEMSAALNEIVGARGHRLTRNLSWKGQNTDKNCGIMVVSADEIASGQASDIVMKMSARHVDKKDLFGKSDPFFKIFKDQGGMKTVVYQSEVKQNTLDPDWKEFTLGSVVFCSNDFNRKITVEVYDWDANSEPDLIGAFETTPNELLAKKKFPLINFKKTDKKDYKNSGEVEIVQFEKRRVPSFFDFLSGGCQISFMVAIDFTGSNGNPNDTKSLHYRNPAGPNEYMQAIYATGAVLEPYDADRQFPVFGFGAKLPNGVVSHDFHVNFNENDPTVFGVPGIINAYINSLNRVELYGPTNFAPIIRKAISTARASPPHELKYHVLLIITDGAITDFDETRRAVAEASRLPVSILIVGVGSADFGMMEKLDGDDKALKGAARDIVQFVPYRKSARSPAHLAEQLLAEIPNQLLSYMKANKLVPKNFQA